MAATLVATERRTSEPSTSYRKLRADVWARHGQLLSQSQSTDHVERNASASPSANVKGKMKACCHPRWHLVDEYGIDRPNSPLYEPRSQPSPVGMRGGLGPNYIPSETTVRNDSSQRFVDTGCGQLPGNSVRNPDLASRFQEYPRLEKLLQLKGESLAQHSHPPYYIRTDLRSATTFSGVSGRSAPEISSAAVLGQLRFDVIVIDAPLETYEWDDPTGAGSVAWSWTEIAGLPVPALAAKESFVFLWVGSGAGDGLERGRELLAKWGYRRCEDIVWVRTNSDHAGQEEPAATTAFTRTAQHCLMGIRGTVRRSRDHHFVHCNVDTDVIMWPGEPKDAPIRAGDDASSGRNDIDVRKKPPELAALAEHFCLGTRRLHLFGDNRTLRRGWLTVGDGVGPGQAGWEEAERGLNACAAGVRGAGAAPKGYVQPAPQPFDREAWQACVKWQPTSGGAAHIPSQALLPFSPQIDELRPKSPTRQDGRAGGANTSQSRNIPWNSTHIAAAGIERTRGSALDLDNAVRPAEGAFPHTYPLAMFAPAHVAGWASSGVIASDGHGPRGAPAGPVQPVPGGAGLSGLGAGGPRTVSVPSGNDTLSGPQASVLLGRANRAAGPTGLGRPR